MSTISGYPVQQDFLTTVLRQLFDKGCSRATLFGICNALLIKYVYDNLGTILNKFPIKKHLSSTVYTLLYILRWKSFTLTKVVNDLYTKNDIRLDVQRLSNALSMGNMSSYQGLSIGYLLGHIVVLHCDLRDITVYCISGNLLNKIEREFQLSAGNKPIVTEYRQCVASGDEFQWVTPSRITKFHLTTKDARFYSSLQVFVRNSRITQDTTSMAYLINGPPGTGKSTIIDIVYQQNIIHQIIRVNMMLFISSSLSLREILETVVYANFKPKVSDETWLLCLDEIDKWIPLWVAGQVQSQSISEHPFNGQSEKEFIQHLYDTIYHTIQLLYDGDVFVSVPRLIIMFFTNHVQTIWEKLTPQYHSVKSRFMILEFTYCNRDDVQAYLEKYYQTLNVGLSLEDQTVYSADVYSGLKSNIQISYRDLRILLCMSGYNLDEVIQRVNNHQVVKCTTPVTTYNPINILPQPKPTIEPSKEIISEVQPKEFSTLDDDTKHTKLEELSLAAGSGNLATVNRLLLDIPPIYCDDVLSSMAGRGHLDVIEALVKHGVDTSLVMWNYCQTNDVDGFKIFLKYGFVDEQFTPQKQNAYIGICESGSPEFVKLLFEHGLDRENIRWVERAYRYGNLTNLKLLISLGCKYDLSMLGSYTNAKDEEFFKYILELEVTDEILNEHVPSIACKPPFLKVAAPRIDINEALCHASRYKESLEICLENGADIHYKNDKPLFTACCGHGHSQESIHNLLHYGANIQAIQPDDHYLKLLQDNGHNIYTFNLTPFDCYTRTYKLTPEFMETYKPIVDTEESRCLCMVTNVENFNILLQYGAGSTVNLNRGLTMYLISWSVIRYELVKAFIDAGATECLLNDENHQMVKTQYPRVYNLLVERGFV